MPGTCPGRGCLHIFDAILPPCLASVPAMDAAGCVACATHAVPALLLPDMRINNSPLCMPSERAVQRATILHGGGGRFLGCVAATLQGMPASTR